ncbi:hypothetical protein F2Q68_00045173 [Brassica cretica]|uniref:Uncharacterized protein n=1 Tax=Brassica cretica TaxID=69181 RepID=A0A8S9LNJ1_BRACR|nr:hypothetical protein F2Q68_00045173 [Brassica cretica]
MYVPSTKEVVATMILSNDGCFVDDGATTENTLRSKRKISKGRLGGVRELWFYLMWSAEPISLPKCLYICDGLVSLHLGGKVLVEFSFSACLTDLRLLYGIQR